MRGLPAATEAPHFLAVQERKSMQEIWSQNYDPAGNVWVSALVALIPILFFFIALTKL